MSELSERELQVALDHFRSRQSMNLPITWPEAERFARSARPLRQSRAGAVHYDMDDGAGWVDDDADDGRLVAEDDLDELATAALRYARARRRA
jgi:hypothetical protein